MRLEPATVVLLAAIIFTVISFCVFLCVFFLMLPLKWYYIIYIHHITFIFVQ